MATEKTEKFYIIAKNETEYWDAETLAKHNLEAAFGIYAVRVGEATFCCEILREPILM